MMARSRRRDILRRPRAAAVRGPAIGPMRRPAVSTMRGAGTRPVSRRLAGPVMLARIGLVRMDVTPMGLVRRMALHAKRRARDHDIRVTRHDVITRPGMWPNRYRGWPRAIHLVRNAMCNIHRRITGIAMVVACPPVCPRRAGTARQKKHGSDKECNPRKYRPRPGSSRALLRVRVPQFALRSDYRRHYRVPSGPPWHFVLPWRVALP